MAYSANPVRGDGSTLLFEDPLTPDSYIEIEENVSGIDISTARTFVDAPRLRDTGSTRKIDGLTEENSGEFTLNDTPGLSSTADFVALADAYTQNLSMRHVRTTGEQVDFVVNLAGVKRTAMESGQVAKIAIPYSITGTPTFTEV
jgi:hypothetical protein